MLARLSTLAGGVRALDVVIPFRKAILAAFLEHMETLEKSGAMQNIKVRLRRDTHGLITAVKTSAILHQAQRMRDERGRIVADPLDYQHAYEAFEPGLAVLYQIKASEALLAVVKAIEAIGVRNPPATFSDIRVSVSELMTELGIAGRGTAANRLKAAEAAGYIQLTSVAAGTRASFYKILKASNVIAEEMKAGKVGSGVFPSPAEIKKKMG
jgi:hypothetical protein